LLHMLASHEVPQSHSLSSWRCRCVLGTFMRHVAQHGWHGPLARHDTHDVRCVTSAGPMRDRTPQHPAAARYRVSGPFRSAATCAEPQTHTTQREGRSQRGTSAKYLGLGTQLLAGPTPCRPELSPRRRHAAANSTATSSRYRRQVQPLLENAQPPTRRSVGLRFCIRCCRSPHHSPARLSVNACIDSMPCNVRACSAVRLYPTSAGACELHWTTRQASVCLTHAARIDPEAVSGSCGQRQPLALPCCPPPRW